MAAASRLPSSGAAREGVPSRRAMVEERGGVAWPLRRFICP
jgi:hypothetical protein